MFRFRKPAIDFADDDADNNNNVAAAAAAASGFDEAAENNNHHHHNNNNSSSSNSSSNNKSYSSNGSSSHAGSGPFEGGKLIRPSSPSRERAGVKRPHLTKQATPTSVSTSASTTSTTSTARARDAADLISDINKLVEAEDAMQCEQSDPHASMREYGAVGTDNEPRWLQTGPDRHGDVSNHVKMYVYVCVWTFCT